MKKECKEIEPKDSLGRFHGYQEWYVNNLIWARGNNKHGHNIGYVEWHKDSELSYDPTISTNFYIK